jgi:hypothetical protein
MTIPCTRRCMLPLLDRPRPDNTRNVHT